MDMMAITMKQHSHDGDGKDEQENGED